MSTPQKPKQKATTLTTPTATSPTTTTTTTKASTKKKSHKPRAVKVESQNAHFALVFAAAQTVTEILKSHGIPCAIFGSLASRLYGSPRCPKDVDVLISQEQTVSSDSDSSESGPLSAPELKNLILRTNSRNFYLKMPRDPQAEYRIMWYRESHLGPECKVDILVPGTMHLPAISANRVHWIDGIPLVPFSLLLLHKLQGWDDHRLAPEKHKNKKQQQDAADVRRLMTLRHMVEELTKTKPWDDGELFSDEFRDLTVGRVKEYGKAFPDRVEDWKQLGFEVA